MTRHTPKEETLLAKIEELENENKRLAKLLETGSTELQPLCPYSYEKLHSLNMGKTDISNLAKCIRHYVFKETEYKTKKVGTSFVLPRNMSNVQYALYVKILNSMIQALEDGRTEAVEKGINGWADNVHL